jgi:hypothetical protein
MSLSSDLGELKEVELAPGTIRRARVRRLSTSGRSIAAIAFGFGTHGARALCLDR